MLGGGDDRNKSDSEAVQILDATYQFEDTYVEMTGHLIPISERYPDGIKYSLQYGEIAGETIIRYDNFPDHPNAAHHHKHTEAGEVVDIKFDDIESLYERFRNEVREHGDKLPELR